MPESQNTPPQIKRSWRLSFNRAFTGDACLRDTDCSDGLFCEREFDDGSGAFPSGMCSAPCPKHTCFDKEGSNWTRCVEFEPSDTPICMIECGEEGACREGYTCTRLDRSNEEGTRFVCAPQPQAAATALTQLRSTPPPSDPAPREEEPRPQVENTSSPLERDQAEGLVVFNTHEEDATNEAVADDAGGGAAWVIVAVLLVAIGAVAVFLLRARIRARGNAYETPLEALRRSMDDRKKPSGENEESPSGGGAASRPPGVEEALSRAEPRTAPVNQRASRPLVGYRDPVGAPTSTASNRGGHSSASALISEWAEHESSRHPPSQPRVSDQATPAAAQTTHAPPMVPASTGYDEAPLGTQDPVPPTEPSWENSEAPLRTRPEGRLVPSLRRDDADEAAPRNVHTPASSNPAWRPGRQDAEPPSGLYSRVLGTGHTVRSADDLIPPVRFDVTLMLIDRVLVEAESFRKRRGYEDITLVAPDGEDTQFQLMPDGEIRVLFRSDALQKIALAPDIIRRRGFKPDTSPSDAHLLSLINLGRHLLGRTRSRGGFRSIEELTTAAPHLDSLSQRLIDTLAHEGRADIPTSEPAAPTAVEQRTMVGAKAQNARMKRFREAAVEEAQRDATFCPSCASDIEAGDLACRHCGSALHPQPFFCPSCGTRNVLFADGREQECINTRCTESIDGLAPPAALENRRLAAIFDLLSSFEEFRKVRSGRTEEHYEAIRNGKTIDIVQTSADLTNPLMESDRELLQLSDVVRLPTTVSEEAGLTFVLYERTISDTSPIFTLGSDAAALRVFELLAAIHHGRLSASELILEDLEVDTQGRVVLRHGHRLRRMSDRRGQRTDHRFTAPEVLTRSAPTEASDIFAFAAMWYYAVVGEEVPVGGLPREQPDDVLTEPTTWDTMVRCLDRDPDQRPDSAADVVAMVRGEKRLTDLI